MSISKRLKERREELGLKVKDIAIAVEVAESTYREWENGRKIQGEPYAKLAAVLNLPMSALFGEDPNESLKDILARLDELENHVKDIRLIVLQIF